MSLTSLPVVSPPAVLCAGCPTRFGSVMQDYYYFLPQREKLRLREAKPLTPLCQADRDSSVVSSESRAHAPDHQAYQEKQSLGYQHRRVEEESFLLESGPVASWVL